MGGGSGAALEGGIPLGGVVGGRGPPEPGVQAGTPWVSRPARPARPEGRTASRRTRPAVVAATLMGSRRGVGAVRQRRRFHPGERRRTPPCQPSAPPPPAAGAARPRAGAPAREPSLAPPAAT